MKLQNRDKGSAEKQTMSGQCTMQGKRAGLS